MSERRMNTTELATHLFCTTQAEEKLQSEGTHCKAQARRTLLDVKRKVRRAVQELSDTVPNNRIGTTS